MSAKAFVSAGAPLQERAGDSSAPSQVCCLGISPPGVKAALDRVNAMAVPLKMADIPVMSVISRGRTLHLVCTAFPRMGRSVLPHGAQAKHLRCARSGLGHAVGLLRSRRRVLRIPEETR